MEMTARLGLKGLILSDRSLDLPLVEMEMTARLGLKGSRLIIGLFLLSESKWR